MDYFNKYKRAKNALCKLVCQFYDYEINKYVAERLGVKYKTDDINGTGDVECYYHRSEPMGLYIWHKLGIEKDIITMDELWQIMEDIYDEEEDIEKDYHKEYLEYKLMDIDIVKKYYKHQDSKKFLDEIGMEYDPDLDELEEGKIEGYDHYFESAGEAVWCLINYENNFIPASVMDGKRQETLDELFELNMNKQKKLGTIND